MTSNNWFNWLDEVRQFNQSNPDDLTVITKFMVGYPLDANTGVPRFPSLNPSMVPLGRSGAPGILGHSKERGRPGSATARPTTSHSHHASPIIHQTQRAGTSQGLRAPCPDLTTYKVGA
ncbi:hypothetical protein CYMTET_56320 [Cymbomonas tetramitiformis]|uniref:Uncharacterized protein n=1 Tax=Cymbomonas tetramitiformis TaxID=36881 RepID=A0AAE0ENW1_9CHLO|nr:hypothetical protein CYMTET_56320 [Cymbomonas tetramitiformis]